MIFKGDGLRSKTYKRTLIILLVTFESMLLIFAVALFGLFRHISTDEIENLNEEIVEKISSNTQYMNELVNKYSMLIFIDNVINPLLYNDGSGVDRAREIQILNHLHNMSDAYGIIHSVIIYNGVADRFYSWDSNYCEDEFVGYVKNNIESVKSPILRELPRENYYNGRNAMTYVVEEPYGTGGFLIINVNGEWVNNNLSKADGKYNKLFIIDSNGSVIAQKKGTEKISVPETLMNGIKDDKGSVKYTDENGKNVTAIYHHIKDSDWTMVSLNYYNEIYSMIRNMQLAAIILTLAFGCFGIFIVMMTGKSIYSPVRTLVAKIEKSFGTKKRDQDEMEYLYEVLEQSSEMNKPDCRVVLKEILLNGTDYRFEEFLSLSENLKTADKIVLIYIKTIFHEQADDVFKDIRCEMVTMKWENVIVIAADAADMNRIEHACVSLTGKSEPEVISYSAPLGLNDKLSENYRKLENNASYSVIYGSGRIITEETISANVKNENMLIYPDEMAKELTKLLTKGSMEEINRVFGEFLNDVSQNTVNNYLIALMKLVMELFGKTANRQDRMGAYSQRILTASSRQCIQDIFMEMFDELIPLYRRCSGEQLSTKAPSKSDIVIEAVKMIVNNQYYCKSLSVASIAEEMKMSSGYLGKLFKNIEGITISDYIHKTRIDNAVKILSMSDYNVKNIMELVGYDNESTFYSKFKKYTGMTPKEFKTMNSNTSGMIY